MSNWIKWLALGILSVVFGLFALGNAVAASLAVTVVTGLLFLAAGGIQVAVGLSEAGTGRKVFSVLMGVLMLILGVSFVANPLEGVVSLALLVTIMLAASGILRLVLAWGMQATQFFWPMLTSGALSVLLAGYVVANCAGASGSLLGILLGIELLFNGAGLIALAFFVKAYRK
jgi:uncharacterized membrane protein HdeD (DUF308 family)